MTGSPGKMSLGEALVIVDLCLCLQVLSFFESLPVWILPAAMDSLVQDVAILSGFNPLVPRTRALTGNPGLIGAHNGLGVALVHSLFALRRSIVAGTE